MVSAALGSYITSRKTFGQKFQIAKDCVDLIVKGPQLQLNEISAFIRFSADLSTCTNTLADLNYLDQIDNLDIDTKICRRLPFQRQNSWQAEVDKILHVKINLLSIKDLATFVAVKTRLIINLYFLWSHSSKISRNKRKKTSLVTSIKTPDVKKCKLCKNLHFLNQCKEFRRLSFNERLDFVTKSKLCWSCLEGEIF